MDLDKEKNSIRYHKGYRFIKCDNHPFASTQGFVSEHRLVAEQYLLNDDNSIIIDNRKYLSHDFAVHHIDFNRLNNNPKNLFVMESNKHVGLHRKLHDKQYFLSYCEKFGLNPDVARQTRADFKSGQYKKYKNI
jgi:hypothetical protein